MSTFDPRAFEDETGLELERYPLGGCERKRRGGAIDYPYEGCSVWLTPNTPIGLITGALGLGVMQANEDAVAGERGFDQICQALSECVAGLDIPAAPTVWGNPAGLRSLPSELLGYIMNIANTGEVPEDRPNASTRGRNGSITPRSTAKTRTESTGHPRPENG